ncbi:hypothetical protein PENSPDRAFT_132786 [Peniophora sp. CONT]|nr:hypothetical protein PENSPDRAFT_132786 [Peniophora sp. CONT]
MLTRFSIDASATKTVWRSLIDLDATCETQEVTFTSGGSVNVIEDHALALRLNGTIDWLLGAINLLRVQRSRNDQARVRLAPVLCLSESELVIIFELVAESEAPQAKALGWMRLSHVCGVWRNVLLGMSDLWGRDAYAFGAGVATTDILPRVESGLLSVTTLRPLFDSDGKLPAFCRGLVPFRRKAEFEALELKARQGLISDLNLSGGAFALPYLGRILGNRSQPHLRAVNIRVLWRPKEDETSGLQMPMAPHPNLRHVALVNIFIPFTLPRLVSLHVVSKVKGKHMPQVYLDALLDSLEASPTLKDLCILHLVLPSPPVARNITLPNLDTLCSDDDGILQHLHLPALRRALTIGSGSTAPET